MAVAFQPTLRLYRRSPLWGLALPAIALCYMLFTLDSALQYARGKGGLWKGRVQATGTMTTRSRRIALRQGPPGRELPGRVAAHPSAPPRRHPGVLRIRPHRRRYRRSCDARASARSSTSSTGSKPASSAAMTSIGEAVALRDGLARAEPVAAPRPGPLDGLPDGCDQAALSRLGRPDGLLQLLRHAGGPLRARRARRGSRDLAGQRRAVRGAADHQPPAGLQEGLSRLDRVYVPEDALAAAGATRRGHSAATTSTPALRHCLRALAAAPDTLLDQSAVVLRPHRAISGWPWRSR